MKKRRLRNRPVTGLSQRDVNLIYALLVNRASNEQAEYEEFTGRKGETWRVSWIRGLARRVFNAKN